jgi:hypothetical protein
MQMLKKTITYEDFNGASRTEDFYFNLTVAELMEMQVSKAEGFKDYIEGVINADNREELIAQFKKLILSSVGRRSEDGSRFFKSQEIRNDFASTNAFGALFMEFVTSEAACLEFVKGIVPANFEEQIAALPDNGKPGQIPTPAELNDEPTPAKKWDDYSEDELLLMSDRLFAIVFGGAGKTKPPKLMQIAMQRRNASQQ